MEETDIYYSAAKLFGKYSKRLEAVPKEIAGKVCDIRLKLGESPVLCTQDKVYFIFEKDGESVCNKVTQKDIDEIIYRLCDCSVYSREEEIKEGFISAKNGLRVGICGTAVTEDKKIRTIRNISSISMRIPRMRMGCADGVAKHYVNLGKGILIAGEPSSGKTTFLRDLIFSLSSGKFTEARRVAVLDERRELGMFDLGPLSDVLAGYPKECGLETAVRVLSPQVVACDEIGQHEFGALDYAAGSGAELIATIHASKESYYMNRTFMKLIRKGWFKTVVFMRGRRFPSQIDEIREAGDLLEASRDVPCNGKRIFSRLYGFEKA